MIKYNFNERNKYAKYLLLIVRFPLLSDHALDYVLRKTSSFHSVEKCLAVIDEILKQKEKYFHYSPNSFFTSRYCSQNNFDILFGGDFFSSNDSSGSINTSFVDKIDGGNLISSRKVPSLTNNRRFTGDGSSIIYLKGHIYFFNCLYTEDSNIKKVEKYSIATDSLEVVAEIFNDRSCFCACGFIDKVYFVGGYKFCNTTATCTQFDANDYTWKDVASMNETRVNAACTVFEGRIVVAGGLNGTSLRTVEAYDHLANEWSYMPNMIERGSDHDLVAIKNKLFAMGGWKNLVEVFDSTCKKFVAIKPTVQTDNEFMCTTQAISMENKVVIFFLESSTVLCYNVDQDVWTEECCFPATDGLNFYTKIPKLNV